MRTMIIVVLKTTGRLRLRISGTEDGIAHIVSNRITCVYLCVMQEWERSYVLTRMRHLYQSTTATTSPTQIRGHNYYYHCHEVVAAGEEAKPHGRIGVVVGGVSGKMREVGQVVEYVMVEMKDDVFLELIEMIC